MEENDFLRSILASEKIGWWEADMSRRMFHLSDTVRDLLGLSACEAGFDIVWPLVDKPYREFASALPELSGGVMPNERRFPMTTPRGPLWVSSKVLSREVRVDGTMVLKGYLRVIPEPRHESGTTESERVNDLLFRLNSISHSLLSLQSTDRAETVVDEILKELLAMFHGSRSYIIEFDWEQRTHVCTYEVTAGGVKPERDFVNQFSMDELSWWTERITAGEPVILTTLDDLPAEAAAERAVLEAQSIRSLIVMPLRSREKIWGYAGIDIVERVRAWSSEDCMWFSSLVNIIGLCLELQRSEQEAQDERDYLQGLYRHMPLGYVRMRLIWDGGEDPSDYEILDSNYAADEILGLERSQYVGRRASRSGALLDQYLSGLAEVARTGQYVMQDACMGPRGRSLHVVLYTTRKDEVICLFTDMTEMHEAHEALDRNEKLLRNIYDNIPIGIELYDRNGILVDINNKDMDIFGVRSKDDVVGVNFFENPNVPDDVRDGVREGRMQSFRLNYRFNRVDSYYDTSKTGYIELFTTVSMLYDTHGRLVNYLLMNIDNTEINRAHSRLAEFESSFSLVSRYGKVGYCRFDLISKEGYGVPQWYLNLGEKPDTPLREVIGVYSQVDASDRENVFAAIRRVRAGEADSFSLDLRIRPGINETWTRINVMRNPLNNDPSKIEMVCVNYDITELKRTERSLIEAKNRAEVSDRLKSAFLANMSHEIRTPLNAIVGFSNLLTETDDPEERRSFIRIVEENNDLLLKLISDILDLSKIEAGTFEFNYGTVDVLRMCREIVQALQLKVRDKSVELRLGEHCTPCRIEGDKNRLMQVVTNFINNAVKFTPEGTITLDYRVEGGQVLFSVEDTGSGIPAEQLPMIFERFVKLDSFAQGTGLGLSICKSIVEQMGGRIGVDSKIGHGSRFWFTVPVGECAEPGDAEAEAEVEQPAVPIVPSNPDGKRPLLLIAEDTDSNYLLLRLMLGKEYEIVRACDGAEAVRLCAEKQPDAVLMDVKMPVMDGLEATRGIRLSDTRVPIIAITAFAYDQDRQRVLDAGCDEYLSKPVSGERLRQLLRTLILRRRSE